MYIPKSFKIEDRARILSFIRANAFAQLISMNQGKLCASHLPFLLGNDDKVLCCHLAKSNSQWQDIDGQEVLVSFEGVHGYISPTWYKNPGVPTWNYQAAQVSGVARIITDESALKTMVNELTVVYESTQDQPWVAEYKDSLLQFIVGIEIEITAIECTFKLSQNRSEEDRLKVIQELEKKGDKKLAQAIRNTL